jgi:hypothetical protein
MGWFDEGLDEDAADDGACLKAYLTSADGVVVIGERDA